MKVVLTKVVLLKVILTMVVLTKVVLTKVVLTKVVGSYSFVSAEAWYGICLKHPETCIAIG